LICGIPAASVLLAAPAFAETITVCTDGCDYNSIQAAIDAAEEEGDVIEIGAGVWRENLNSNKQLVLRGAGPNLTIIDGSDGSVGWSPCLVVSEDFDGWETQERFRVEGLTLRGGSGAEIFGLIRGGGVYIEFAPVTFSNVVIEDCSIESINEFTIEGIGGAICNFFGDVVVESSVLRNNSCFTTGGAIFTTSGQLQIFDTLIEGNIGEVEGGAIFAYNSSVSIEQSTICNNSFEQIVGGFIDLGSNTISTDCSVLKCPADFNGDGLVNGEDLSQVLVRWGACDEGCPEDLNGDGYVDSPDLGLMLGYWGTCEL
jgi:predicted outer membrane repeat protein